MSLGTLRCPYVNDRKNQNRGYDWGEGRTGKILNVSLRVIWFEGLNGVVIGSNISSRELDGPTLEVARAMENSCSPDVILMHWRGRCLPVQKSFLLWGPRSWCHTKYSYL